MKSGNRLGERIFFKQMLPLLKGGLIVFFVIALALQLKGWQAVPGLMESSKKLFDALIPMYIVVALLLVIANIWMEALKWKTLVSCVYPIALSQAVKEVLSGWALGIFTPQRIGEYAGRLLVFRKADRAKGVFLVFTGSVAQNLVHVLGVMPLVIWWLYKRGQPIWILGGAVVWVMLCGVLLYLYFHVSSFLRVIRARLASMAFFKDKLPQSALHLPKEVLFQVLLFSFVRYLAYLSLFVLLLKLLVPEQEIMLLYLYLPVVFLLQSGLPFPPAVAFLARIQFALLVLRGFHIEETHIVTAGIWLWVLNLLLPSLVGLRYILKSNSKNITHNE